MSNINSRSLNVSYDAPYYNLDKLKQNIRNGEDSYHFTRRAIRELNNSLTDIDDVLNVILNLDLDDFHKSMESKQVAGTFQDAYRVKSELGRLYIKLQENPQDYTIIISVHYGWEDKNDQQ